MSIVKQIQCPACGANSTFKQTDGTYRCNYCQSTFEVKESSSKQSFKNISDINTTTAGTRPKRIIALGILSSAIAMIGAVVAFSLSASGDNEASNQSEEVLSEWQKPSLNIYQCFAGSKGPVVWEIYRQDKMRLDSCKYDIIIMDPENNSVLTEKPVFQPMPWKELFTFSKKIEGQFFQIGDIAYNCSEDKGLAGYDIYDFSVKEDASTLGKKYPELNSGISKAGYMYYKKGFRITTNKGEEYVWYPETNLLRSKQEDDAAYKTDTITETKIYTSDDNARTKLYLARWRQDKYRDEMQIGSHILKDYEKNRSYYKKSYHLEILKSLTDKIFFNAKPLFRSDELIVLVYTDDLSKKAKVHMECIDQNGNSVWKNSEAVLDELKSSNSGGFSFEQRNNRNLLAITTYGADRKSFGIDLKTGKLLWTYSPAK